MYVTLHYQYLMCTSTVLMLVFAFFIDSRCVCGDVAGSGVLWSGILPVVILSLGHNSNQGDEHHWQRETCHHCKGRVECASCMTESA